MAIRTRVMNSGYSLHRQPLCRINIGSLDLQEYWNAYYGITSHKSLRIPFPTYLINPIPYLRGYFDGNGSINSSCCNITTGSYNFTEGLCNWYQYTYGTRPYVYKYDHAYKIVFFKKDIIFIHQLFTYPGLKRKNDIYLEFFSEWRDRNRW